MTKTNIGCIDSSFTCPWGYYGASCETISTDCSDAVANGIIYNGHIVVHIQPVASPSPFEVVCFLAFGGWTTILERNLACTGENFNRSLAEYESGFGTVLYNSWLGFDKILQIFGNPNTEFKLLLDAKQIDSSQCQIFYNKFTLGNKSTNYAFDSGSIFVGPNIPSCGDSMTDPTYNLKGQPFSTYDADFTVNSHCPKVLGGGWWFKDISSCSRSFLTGTMDNSLTDNFWKDDLLGATFKWVNLKLMRKLPAK